MDQQPAQPDAFYIPATVSLQERQRRTLKSGDTFGVFDQSGNVLGGPNSSDGVYFRDTRHLCKLGLLVGGEKPMLLSSSLRDDNAELTCDLANGDIYEDGRLILEHDLLHIRRSRFLWEGACFERLSVRSFADQPKRIRLELLFEADFTDLFESRGMHRKRRGEQHPPEVGSDRVTLSYTGLDQQRRSTRLRFDPKPTEIEGGRVAFDLELAAGGRRLIFLDIACDPSGEREPPRRSFLRSLYDARRRLRAESSKAAAVATSNEVFNEAMRRAICDLYMLVTDKDTGPYPYAGVPWFSAAFGRDALITALQTLWLDPRITAGVLTYLAANQATEVDRDADAEPGKILHEVRHGEMAMLREVPFRRYYGSVDSTPLFVMLAGAYLERTGDLETVNRLWPNIMAALDWIEHYGDRDGDGFVEYSRATGEGLANQGWKDSYDSISHADGSLATGSIALAEVQGYAYAARRAAAAIARALGDMDRAAALEARAETLKSAFEAAFWCEELGTYGLALDGAKQLCRVRASNAGHLLFAGILSPERGQQVATQLMSSRMYTGWGIRTLGLGEARYNPISYHNGSVWPHDNSLIALGMARYGCKAEAARLFAGMFDACRSIDLRRLPELFCGFPRRRAEAPTNYPVACSPQAWAATALPAMLQACLGMSFDPAQRLVRFDRPVLPPSLAEVTVMNIELNDARISVRFHRMGEEVAMNVLDRTGVIHATLTS